MFSFVSAVCKHVHAHVDLHVFMPAYFFARPSDTLVADALVVFSCLLLFRSCFKLILCVDLGFLS